VADLRGLNPEDFAPISGSIHNPVVIAIRDGASAGMVDALMLEGDIHALVDMPVEPAAMLRAVNDARAHLRDRGCTECRHCAEQQQRR
jgi:hypothetical protein